MESISMGIEIARNWDDLRVAAKKQIDKYQQDALAEQFVPGREFAVGMIGNSPNLEVLPVVEINLGGPDKIQTTSIKARKGGADKTCPAPLSKQKTEELGQLCTNAFTSLGLDDYARADIRMGKDDGFYVLELNSMAGIGLGGPFFYAAKAAGYTYESMVNKILDVGAARCFGAVRRRAEKS